MKEQFMPSFDDAKKAKETIDKKEKEELGIDIKMKTLEPGIRMARSTYFAGAHNDSEVKHLDSTPTHFNSLSPDKKEKVLKEIDDILKKPVLKKKNKDTKNELPN